MLEQEMRLKKLIKHLQATLMDIRENHSCHAYAQHSVA